jgi:capsular polysaccharide biosynthesis protein
MEKLSFAEQISTFRQAEVIAGVGGAAFTLLNFCRPGTKVLSIMCDEDTSAGAVMKMWDTVAALNGIEFYRLCAPSPNLYATVGSASFVADLELDVKLFEQMIGALIS